MTGLVTTEGLQGHYSASVAVVDSVIDAANGMFGVRLEMKNRKESIPGGIRCQVEFSVLDAAVSGPENVK